MVSGRLSARSLLLVLRRRGRNSRFLLIVGTNDRAIGFAESVHVRPELGYHIVGFVDDDWVGMPKFEATGNTLCCSFSGLADFLRHNVVDEAAIYLPLRSYYEHAAQLVSVCEHHGISFGSTPKCSISKSRLFAGLSWIRTRRWRDVVNSAQSGPARRQAVDRLSRLRDGPCTSFSGVFGCRSPCEVYFGWSRIFSTEEGGAKQEDVQYLQVSHHVRRCRKGARPTSFDERDDRPGIQNQARSEGDASWSRSCGRPVLMNCRNYSTSSKVK